MGQREYLQECCNRYGDFKVARAWKDKEGNVRWTKWMSVMECWHSDEGLKFLDVVNNRTIFPCEIVLDLDDNPTEEKMQQILNYLDEKDINYKSYSTGSRGYHIHIIDHNLILQPDIEKIKKEIKNYIIRKFECDTQKSSDNVMIALENAPHWKTGKTKTLISQRG